MEHPVLQINWHPPGTDLYLTSVCASTAALCALAFAVYDPSVLTILLGALFLFAALSLCVKAQTFIDPNTRQVVREERLFGKYRVRRRAYPFAAFKTVIFRLYEVVDENGTVRIGLRRQNGRIMDVCYFNVGRGPDAGWERRSDAMNLSRAIGLPVEEAESGLTRPGR